MGLALQGQAARLVRVDHRDHKAIKVKRGKLAERVVLVVLVVRVERGALVPPVRAGHRDQVGLPALKVIRVKLAKQGHQAHPVRVDRPVVLAGQVVRVELVGQALRDLVVRAAQAARVDRPVVLVVPAVREEPGE